MAANYDSFQNHCHFGHRCSTVYTCWMRHFWSVKSGEMFRHLSTWDATICERITDHTFLLIFIKIFEMRKVYDGSDASDVQCQVSKANEGRNCNVSYYWTRSTHMNIYIYIYIQNLTSLSQKTQPLCQTIPRRLHSYSMRMWMDHF
jgi:hypothetical protein